MKTKRIAKAILAVSMIITSLFMVVGCRKKLTDTPLEGLVKVADFTQGENESFFPSNGWDNGDPFNVTWSKKNVKYEDGVAKLFITEKDDKDAKVPFYGGELRSKDHYHYGDYEITMKVEPKKGTCTSFFVYTGPSEYDENGNPNPHDEVDIEFLGKDTTHVQFNFFVNGKGGNEHMYDLGFDASEDFHTYGFRWTESYITWYVDGVPVYRVDETSNKPLPKTPGRMMTNYWCGTKNAELWMGKYDAPKDGEASEYKSISTSAEPIVAPEVPGADADIKWDEITPLSGLAAVSSDAKHTIEVNEDKYRVTYSDVQGGTYNNVKFPLGKKAYGMNYLYLNLTNNSSDKYSTVRIDLVGDATNKVPNNKTICNMSATMDGEEVTTDLEWGGTTFAELEPGKTVTIVIYFEGLVTDLQIMFDSSTYQDTKSYAGDITVSNIKFAAYGEVKLPEGVELPTEEEEVIDWANINAITPLEVISSDESHTITINSNTYQVVYNQLQGGSYNNVKFSLGNAANGKNYLYLKVTNNGNTVSGIRVDVYGDATNKTDNNQHVCNVSATMNGNPVSTDMDWGGSTFDGIQPGATVEVVIYFEGVATDIQIMFDSFRYQDTNVYNGDITISDIKLATLGEVVVPTEEVIPTEPIVEPTEDVTPTEPVVDPTEEVTPTEPIVEPTEEPTDEPIIGESWDGTNTKVNSSNKTFTGNLDTYKVQYGENKVKVSYENVKGNSYQNIGVSIHDIAGTNNTFTVIITNNNNRITYVRINIISDTKVNNTTASNISGTMNGNSVWTDLDWGGSKFEIPAGQTVTCVVVFDVSRGTKGIEFMIDSFDGTTNLSSGSIIIADMMLSGSTTDVPTQPEQPTIPVENLVNLTFSGGDGYYTYENNSSEKSNTISYVDIPKSKYCCAFAWLGDITAGYNKITLTVTNNADHLVKLRFDLGDNLAGEGFDSNITSVNQGGSIDNSNDTANYSVQAGETITVELGFTTADALMIFIDSVWDAVNDLNSGQIVVSNVYFSTVE